MLKQKNQTNGVKALEVEYYDNIRESELKRQKKIMEWWSKPICIIFLTIFFSTLDAMVLFTCIDTLLMQQPTITVLVSFGIALMLNILPLTLSKFIYEKRNGEPMAMLWIIITLSAFCILFATTLYMRFTMIDLYLPVSYITGESIYSESGIVKAKAMTLLMSLTPLITSTANFLLAYISGDTLKIEYLRAKVRSIEVAEAISDLRAAFIEMDYDVQMRVDLENQRYQDAKSLVHKWYLEKKAAARFHLMEHLQNPEAITALSNEPSLNQHLLGLELDDSN